MKAGNLSQEATRELLVLITLLWKRGFLFKLSRSGVRAAAKSLQSCPTLCDPTDGSPSGSPIPGILQASPMLESESEVAQSCPTLSTPMDCSLPGSSVHGIFQARVLEWVAISFSRGSSQPKDRTQVSRIAGTHFTI